MSNPLSRIIDWLHEDYPEGVSPRDYYPLLALLTRDATPEQMDTMAARVDEVRGAVGGDHTPASDADAPGTTSAAGTASPAGPSGPRA